MNCLLFGGAQSVGKSETIYRLAQKLVGNGFTLIAGTLPPNFTDFKCILEGTDKNNNPIKIIIKFTYRHA